MSEKLSLVAELVKRQGCDSNPSLTSLYLLGIFSVGGKERKGGRNASQTDGHVFLASAFASQAKKYVEATTMAFCGKTSLPDDEDVCPELEVAPKQTHNEVTVVACG